MAWFAVDVPTCPNDPGIWQHINGWEVVAAVFVIALGWSVVSVARFHYMAVLASRSERARLAADPKEPPGDDRGA